MGEHESPLKGPLPATGGLAGTGGPDGLGGFGRSFLKDSVGRNGANRPEDVLTISRFLHANGLLAEPTRDATEEFHRGIEAAQSKLHDLSRGGLQIDGHVRPWGPTELLSQRAVTSGHMKPPAGEDETGFLIDVLKSISGTVRNRKNPFEGARVVGGIKG